MLLSRVTSKKGLKILITDDNSADIYQTSNVVYKEVFQNAHDIALFNMLWIVH